MAAMMQLDLPIIGLGTTVGGARDLMQRGQRWALAVRLGGGRFGLLDYRDITEAAPESRLRPDDIAPLFDASRLTLRGGEVEDMLLFHAHAFAALAPQGDVLPVITISERLGGAYLGGSPGQRCTHPGKPPGVSNRQWYHYYPPLTPGPAGTCAIDGSPLV
jgi:hypothetical protein